VVLALRSLVLSVVFVVGLSACFVVGLGWG